MNREFLCDGYHELSCAREVAAIAASNTEALVLLSEGLELIASTRKEILELALIIKAGDRSLNVDALGRS